MLTVTNPWWTRTYWLGGSAGHWEWHCHESLVDGFGPFSSKGSALAFARRVGRLA